MFGIAWVSTFPQALDLSVGEGEPLPILSFCPSCVHPPNNRLFFSFIATDHPFHVFIITTCMPRNETPFSSQEEDVEYTIGVQEFKL